MTTIDRRAVQELIVRECMHVRNTSSIQTARQMMLNALERLPSSNAQAVAWQWRKPGTRFAAEWAECTKRDFDNPEEGWEYRALCVCSGDAKEA